MNRLSDKQKSNWYAIYTKPRFEKKVHQVLSQNGYDTYLPLITTIRQWSDRKKKVQLPLISSFVFVNINEDYLKTVLPFDGVIRILKYLGKPAIIRDYEVENLKILLEDTDNINFIDDINLKKGDSVIVEKGAFTGLIAEYIKFNGKHRLIVRIEAIGRLIEVNIPISYVKKMI